jgi:stage II sporulation protein D
MFTHHSIKEKDDTQVLYLYIDYNFEFASFNKMSDNKKKNLYDQIISYITSHKIDFKGHVVYLVLNGLIIGSVLFNYPLLTQVEEKNLSYNYVGQVSAIFKMEDFPSNENKIIDEVIEDKSDVIAKPEEKKGEENTNIKNSPSSDTKKSSANVSAPKTQTPTQPKTEAPKPPAPKVEEPVSPPSNEIMVTLYRSTGIVITIPLEDYIVGVVGAEMPASFHLEALKAQSVAARTYALKMMNENKLLTDTTAHQVYKDDGQLKVMWGSDFSTYYNKIKSAVSATKGEYVSYNNKYIDAVYHSTNNGKTESSLDVFGNYYPYLVSVNSPWDKVASSYLREVTKDFNTINSLLGISLNQDSLITIESRTTGDSINVIKIDDNSFTGKSIREKLGLRSTDFDIIIGENGVNFVTRGYGHGVGMSQYGANGMAKDGYNYRNILNHYYTGTSINKI